MYARHLCEHILAHDRLVGCHADAAEALHHAREVVELALHDVGLGVELVFQDSLYRGQRSIATTLSQAVDGDVQSLGTAEHGSQRVRDRQVVVVMGMEVEVHFWIAFDHLAEVLNHLQGIHHA